MGRNGGGRRCTFPLICCDTETQSPEPGRHDRLSKFSLWERSALTFFPCRTHCATELAHEVPKGQNARPRNKKGATRHLDRRVRSGPTGWTQPPGSICTHLGQ